LRICIIGKFPPIQGGVSMRTYRTAHALAARGHEVHVITNAKEVAPPFRMHMRAEDWARCETQRDNGSVTVHWTDPVDRSQTYIPMASPFVTKLAAIAAQVHSDRPFDVIFSHYMEPYGIAGYLASQMTGAPHVVRMAGSDAGRLWHHPQFEAVYDHVLRSAQIVVAVGEVAERAVQRGVDPGRIASGGGYVLPDDSFTPEGPTIDIGAVRNEIEPNPELADLLWGGFRGETPHFGIYGKLGENKGSFALLDALYRLKLEGLDVGLVALAHGRPDIERRFRERARELELTDRVLQIPYLPHWRMPEFLRGCLAVCCLEQDFPIGFHSPIIPMEVLLCGSCLVASTEVIRKLPQWERLPHGYGCVAVNDVTDIAELSDKLAAILRKPQLVSNVGARGRAFAQACQEGMEFPARLERMLTAAKERRAIPATALSPLAVSGKAGRFPLTEIVSAALNKSPRSSQLRIKKKLAEDTIGLALAQPILVALNEAIAIGNTNLQPFARAVEIEIAIAQAEMEIDGLGDSKADPLFRMRIKEWALDGHALGRLMPVRDCRTRVLRFDYDISEFMKVESIADFPTSIGPGPSHLVVGGVAASDGPLLIDRFTARILELSDGARTSDEIATQVDQESGRIETLDHLAWIENMLLSGLISLCAGSR
jgi:glycosyltransferase involved in cell wall biosynthesis